MRSQLRNLLRKSARVRAYQNIGQMHLGNRTVSPTAAPLLRCRNKRMEAIARHAPCQAGHLALAWPGVLK